MVDGWTPSLILLDLNMPQMDGWTFRARQLSVEQIARVPVVVLSATADLVSAARTLVPVATLSKPFEVDDIPHIVRSVLATDDPYDADASATPAAWSIGLPSLDAPGMPCRWIPEV